MKKLILIVAFCTSCFSFNVLEQYDSYEFDETLSSMNSAYVGPLVATGAAMKSTNKVIYKMESTHIGSIDSNKITLIDDPKNEIYNFDSISYYKVTKKLDTFYIIKIQAKMNDEKYDIILELNEGYSFDRTLTIYKNGYKETLILLIDFMRIKVKNEINI